MIDLLAFKYVFQHKSGRYYIAQSSSEFYSLQMGDKVSYKDIPEVVKNFEFKPWGGRSYKRLGYKEFPRFPSKEQYEAEKRVGKFWEAADPAKKLDYTLFTGYWASGVLLFLSGQLNHAIMVGDEEGYKKAYLMFPFRKNQLTLPSPEEN